MVHFATVVASFFSEPKEPNKSTRKTNETEQYACEREILIDQTNLQMYANN